MGKILFPDYFPFCLENSLPPTSPLILCRQYSGQALSLEALMAAYWRVRKWRVDYSGTDTFGLPVTATGIHGFNVENEESLVCATIPKFELLSFSSSYTPWGANDFRLFSIFDNLIYAATSSYRFAFTLIYYGADDLTQGGSVESGDLCGEGQQGVCDSQTISVTLADAGIIELPVTLCPDREEAFASISITADLYWSYGGTYDTTTGLPL
jgi:hypothetical protein